MAIKASMVRRFMYLDIGVDRDLINGDFTLTTTNLKRNYHGILTNFMGLESRGFGLTQLDEIANGIRSLTDRELKKKKRHRRHLFQQKFRA